MAGGTNPGRRRYVGAARLAKHGKPLILPPPRYAGAAASSRRFGHDFRRCLPAEATAHYPAVCPPPHHQAVPILITRNYMRRLIVSAIALALAGAVASPLVLAADVAAPSVQAVTGTTQLPRNVRPSHYAVSITPHADKLAFDGKVAVDVDVLEPTRTITLNAIDMTFANATLTPKGGKPWVAKVGVDDKAQTATFSFDKPVPAGTYTLSMTYAGKIGTQANGLFAIDYDTKAGKKRALYTQ